MVDLRPRWTMGYPGYGRQSDTMVDPRPRWAMGQWPIESLPTLKSFVPRSVPYSDFSRPRFITFTMLPAEAMVMLESPHI